MAGLSVVTYALSKNYTDQKIIHVSEDVIEEAVRQANEYTDRVASSIEWHKEFVDQLPPIEQADHHTIYFVPASQQLIDDGYFEFIEANGRWEVIGRTVVDLSDYYTKEETEAFVADYVEDNLPVASEEKVGAVKVDGENIQIDDEGTISITAVSENDIESLFE